VWEVRVGYQWQPTTRVVAYHARAQMTGQVSTSLRSKAFHYLQLGPWYSVSYAHGT